MKQKSKYIPAHQPLCISYLRPLDALLLSLFRLNFRQLYQSEHFTHGVILLLHAHISRRRPARQTPKQRLTVNPFQRKVWMAQADQE